MTTALRVLLAISAASGILAGASSSDLPPVEAGAERFAVTSQDGDKPTALEASMAVLKGGQRALRKQIADPKANQEALIANLSEMEAAAHAAIMLTPKAMASVPKGELSARTVAYKQKMAELLVHILAMEAAALTGDKDSLDVAYKAISETKQSGHENFRDL